MGLKDYAPKTEPVALPDGDSFPVRALTLHDLTKMMQRHQPIVEELWKAFLAVDGKVPDEVDPSAFRGLGLSALAHGPDFLADLVALGAGDIALTEVTRLLPLDTQLDAAETIVRLTATAEGGAKKLGERLAGLIKTLGIKIAPQSLPTRSKSGSGA